MTTESHTTKIIKSFLDIDSAQWNKLDGANHPFLRYEFYSALENNGNLNAESGWNCRIVCIYDKEQLIAAMPMFSKDHSWAEFVFDWSWANAYSQHGLQYYPKLLITTPYTPATARKCLTHPEYNRQDLSKELIKAAMDYAHSEKFSSLHAIFLDDYEKSIWKEHDLMERIDCQFHWKNEWLDKEEPEFDDFLSKMNSSKRKKIRQERKSLIKNNIEFKIQTANEIDESKWDDLYHCYANTFLLRGQPPYFEKAFFLELARTMGEQMPIVQAWQDDILLAAAICFKSDDVFYGRYWGKMADINNLHFETCYYQSIEYALTNGLKHIEPGTGGTHKLRRGFQPTLTTSMHWIAHEGFKTAIEEHLNRERPAIESYLEDAKEHLPFKAL